MERYFRLVSIELDDERYDCGLFHTVDECVTEMERRNVARRESGLALPLEYEITIVYRMAGDGYSHR